MGTSSSTGISVPKQGRSYEECKSLLRPFDIILFSGDDFVSDFIKYAERTKMVRIAPTDIDPGAFSHMGMIVTSDILDHPDVLPGKLYIMESTLSGRLGYDIYDVEGKTVFGVQIRDFDEVFNAYDQPNDTRIACSKIKRNPLDIPPNTVSQLKERFTSVYKKYKGCIYDLDLFDEFGTLFVGIRVVRDTFDKCLDASWIFCSQLVAAVYVDMGLLPITTVAKDIVPMDFAGYGLPSSHSYMPQVTEDPFYMVSAQHLDTPREEN